MTTDTHRLHQALIPGWQAPVAPRKYPDLTAIRFVAEFGDGFRWLMDFSRPDSASMVGRFFASDAWQCPQIDWPWREGVTPSEKDWIAIGFTVVEITDLSNSISMNGLTEVELAEFMEVVAEVAGSRGLHGTS
mgnify:CR=1 FL=1|jgi:hypothetical protein